MDITDRELLDRFHARHDEGAFRALVDRHLAMVFGVAERMTRDRGLAEEVAQSAFAALAVKAGARVREESLAGWLYHTARHLALNAVRADVRRRQREQIAAAMNFNEPGPNIVAEHLESAMDQLKPEDRDALVLRFFEDRNLRDVGLELGLSEDAARMRLNRALEKLRGIFGKLGIAGSVAWLATSLPTSASTTVPIGLAASITTAVLSGTAIATAAAITHGASTTMNFLNLKTGAAILAAAAITGTSTYLVKVRDADRLQSELQAANESRGQLVTVKEQAVAAIKLRDDQIAQLKSDLADLPRLRGEVDRLNRELARLAEAEKEVELLKQRLVDVSRKPESANGPTQSETFVYPDSVKRSAYVFSGYGNPTAAFQTQLWAIKNMDAKSYLASQTEKSRELLLDNNFKDLPDGVMPGGYKNGIMYRATGFHVMEATQLSADEVRLKVFMEGANYVMKSVFKKVGNEWKFDRMEM